VVELRTEKEIEEEVKAGEEFVRKHPYSMFGNDNMADFEAFKRIIKLVEEKSIDVVEQQIYDMDEDEEQTRALDVIDWLRGDIDGIYTGE